MQIKDTKGCFFNFRLFFSSSKDDNNFVVDVVFQSLRAGLDILGLKTLEAALDKKMRLVDIKMVIIIKTAVVQECSKTKCAVLETVKCSLFRLPVLRTCT